MAFFSVIIPLYNKEPIIGRSVESVLNQTFKDFELIIVNDGSTDGSMAVVRHYKDERIRIIEQENCGPSKARNVGVQLSKGDWIVFLDADDVLLKEALSHFKKLIEENVCADIICCSFYDQYLFGKKKKNTKEGLISNPFRDYFLGNLFTTTGAFTSKKTLFDTYSFNEQLRRYEDVELWFRLFKSVKIIGNNKAVLCVNRLFAEASKRRIDINEDFIGHLDLKGKSFWEKMSLYKLFIENRELYPKECHELYKSLYYRYDFFLVYKLFQVRK